MFVYQTKNYDSKLEATGLAVKVGKLFGDRVHTHHFWGLCQSSDFLRWDSIDPSHNAG
jgi:hypothetical protein